MLSPQLIDNRLGIDLLKETGESRNQGFCRRFTRQNKLQRLREGM